MNECFTDPIFGNSVVERKKRGDVGCAKEKGRD